jgi:hypothetical protein
MQQELDRLQRRIGGLNEQDPAEAGFEANLDVQFAFGLSYPTPGTFWTVGGRPPFNPTMAVPNNTNGNAPSSSSVIDACSKHHADSCLLISHRTIRRCKSFYFWG